MTLRARFEARVGDFDLAVALEADDELVVLYGRSGSGKSLTLRAIAGLLRPRGGRIEIGGRTVFDAEAGVDLPPQERRSGYVVQEPTLFPHLDLRRNVLIGLERDIDAPGRYEELLRLLSIEGLDGGGRTSSRADSSSGPPSRGRSCAMPTCCCSTSRSRRSTRRCAPICGRSCCACAARCGSRSSSSRTTCARRTCSATASRSSTRAGCCSSARATRCSGVRPRDSSRS